MLEKVGFALDSKEKIYLFVILIGLFVGNIINIVYNIRLYQNSQAFPLIIPELSTTISYPQLNLIICGPGVPTFLPLQYDSSKKYPFLWKTQTFALGTTSGGDPGLNNCTVLYGIPHNTPTGSGVGVIGNLTTTDTFATVYVFPYDPAQEKFEFFNDIPILKDQDPKILVLSLTKPGTLLSLQLTYNKLDPLQIPSNAQYGTNQFLLSIKYQVSALLLYDPTFPTNSPVKAPPTTPYPIDFNLYVDFSPTLSTTVNIRQYSFTLSNLFSSIFSVFNISVSFLLFIFPSTPFITSVRKWRFRDFFLWDPFTQKLIKQTEYKTPSVETISNRSSNGSDGNHVNVEELNSRETKNSEVVSQQNEVPL